MARDRDSEVRCDTCKWWRQFSDEDGPYDEGECTHPEVRAIVYSTKPVDYDEFEASFFLLTPAEWHCADWEQLP